MTSLNDLSLSLMGYSRKQVTDLMNQKDAEIKELKERLDEAEGKQSDILEELERYKQLERTLQDGIIDAREKGNQIIDQSNQEASLLMNQAEEQIIQYKEDFVYHSHELIDSGSDLKNHLNTMKDRMQEILEEYQEILESTNFDRIYPRKKMEQFSMQVESFEADTINKMSGPSSYNAEANLSDQEKEELKRLISDVIDNEEEDQNAQEINQETSDKSADKLLTFRNMG